MSCAAELQGLVLANSSVAARPTLMANLLEAVTEVKEFIATFSERSVPFIILSACLPAYLHFCLPVCAYMLVAFHTCVHSFTCLSGVSVSLSVCFSLRLYMSLSVCLSV